MFYDLTHDVLVYDLEPGLQRTHLVQHIPDAKTLPAGHVAFKATLRNLQLARLCGLPVVRPLHSYDWPRSKAIKVPFHAQTETANFLVVHPRACVLSDMGTGKTLASLWAADALMREAETRGETFRCLVMAPLSTLQTVWADAIFGHFMSRRKAVILHGTPDKRIAALSEPADFYLLNHDGLKVGAHLDTKRRIVFDSFAAALQARTDIRLVIVDEVGAFRDAKTLRSKVARHLIGQRDHLWLMTGTPIPNAPTDAYGIAKLLNNANGETFTGFKNRTMTQISQFKWVAKAGANDEAMKLLQPAIRYSIDDCMDLPELTMQTRGVELSGDQLRMIKDIKRDLLVQMDRGDTITVANEAALRIKLLQIGCGVVYDENHKPHRINCVPSIRALVELIEEASGKVIVFAPFISVVHMLNEALKDFTRCVIVGDTPVKERADIIHRFQQERDPHVLVAHPETISHGQTLTAAATTVWYGPTDKTDVYIQANKRMHRPGQHRPCAVVNIARTGVEREVYRRLASNESQQGLLLKLVKEQWL